MCPAAATRHTVQFTAFPFWECLLNSVWPLFHRGDRKKDLFRGNLLCTKTKWENERKNITFKIRKMWKSMRGRKQKDYEPCESVKNVSISHCPPGWWRRGWKVEERGHEGGGGARCQRSMRLMEEKLLLKVQNYFRSLFQLCQVQEEAPRLILCKIHFKFFENLNLIWES